VSVPKNKARSLRAFWMHRHGQTFAAIGAALGVTRQRAKQIVDREKIAEMRSAPR
jgi:DNA-directed RNA polymerase sigma subunit (sigma70/sigma32)